MSEVLLAPASGLAGLLCALQPPPPAPPVPPPDLDAIRRAGWEDGFAAGEAAADAALAPLRLALAEAAAALHIACTIEIDRLRPAFATLVRGLAEAVLAAELRAGAAVLLPLVEAGLAALRPADQPTLVAHPDVLAQLAPHLPALATATDDALPPDSFAITGLDFIVETSLTARLDRVLGLVA
jgi:flagellar biosynthesis/type III secretory pathway protein FliH